MRRYGTSGYGLVGVVFFGGWLDLMILEVFFNLNDSMNFVFEGARKYCCLLFILKDANRENIKHIDSGLFKLDCFNVDQNYFSQEMLYIVFNLLKKVWRVIALSSTESVDS